MSTIWRKTTLAEQIYRELLRELVSGVIAPGTELPSRAVLESRFGAGKETVKKVLKQLADDGYIHPRDRRPALAVKKLPSRHYTIVVPYTKSAGNFHDFQYSTAAWSWMLYQSVVAALMAAGHVAVLLNCSGDQLPPENIDGMILIGTRATKLRAALPNIPTIIIMEGDYRASGSIQCDRSEAFTRTATYMLAHGMRRVLLLGIDQSRPMMKKFAEQFFIGTLRENGMPDHAISFMATNSTREDGHRVLSEYLRTNPFCPFGVLTVGDFAAAGALAAAIEAGLRPKRDFIIVGCTGLKEVENWTPPLTTVGTPYEEIGIQAAAMIQDYIRTGLPPAVKYVKSKLIIRGS